MNHRDKERAKSYLAGIFLQALDDGLSVEDLIDSLCGAVNERRKRARGERRPAYREELRLFYEETLNVLNGARSQVQKAGEIAKAMTGG